MWLAETGSIAAGLVTRPGQTLDRLAARPVLGAAATAVVGTALVWAALCLLLGLAGHAPSRVLLPLPRQSYYLWQAALLVPTLLVSWVILGGVCHALARAVGGGGSAPSTFACAGFAYAVPLLSLFVIPDLVAYLAFGFASLAKLVRVSGLVLVLAECALVARAVVAAHGLPWSRAVPVALAGLFAQAAVGGTVLR